MITQKQLGAKIKAVRESLGLTQEFVANKISLGRQAVLAIESGKRSVDGVELAKIAELLKVTTDFLLTFENEKVGKNFEEKINIKLHRDKLRNLILYILSRCGGKPNVGETVLYKLLYFIDFDSFELTEKSITGLKYVKLQFGPVPVVKEYCPVLEKMVENNEIKIIKQEYHGFPQKKYIALTDCDQSIFKADEIILINRVINRLSDMTAAKIEAYVHEDIPWKATGTGEIIDYRLVFDRTALFAQSDREFLWQTAAGIDAIKDLDPISDEEYNYYEKL